MREILFKAKNVKNGEWIEGCYHKKYAPLGNEEHLIFHADSYKVWEYAEISPETLCQFTGLCDKNGKKIWENDILKAHLDNDYPEYITFEKVEWNNFGWTLREPERTDWEYINPSDSEIYEVAGNVFDNPELLQEDAE